MKVTPRKVQKFQQGGSAYSQFFTVFNPPQPKQASQPATTASASKKESKKDGDIDMKDLLTMIKDVDGLPMEMMSVIKPLQDTLTLSNLAHIAPPNLTTTYIDQVLKIKLLAANKEKFKESVKAAETNGSLGEPAIAMNGDLVVQDSKTGKLETVSLKQFKANPSSYKILTVANLKYLREWDPRLNFDQEAFDIIRNSMGYEAFQKLLKEGIDSLGTSRVNYNGYVTNEGEASKGWQLVKNMSKEDRERIVQAGMTLEGMYEYKVMESSQLGQIQELVNYLVAVMPQRAKTWAAIKLGSDDPQKAIQTLVLQSLLSRNSSTHQITVDYKGTMDHVMGLDKGTKGSGGKEEDPKEGFWRQAQSGKGGDETTFSLLVNKGTLSVQGKFYGTTPGLTQDCSLNDYLSNSGVRYMIKDPKSITFGDTRISTDSFNDVMVKAGSGAFVATLPVKDGKVWIEAVEAYSNFESELRRAGVKQGTQEYANKARELLNKPEYMGLAPLIASNGALNPNNAGQFLVLEGLVSSKTSGISNKDKKKHSFNDINSNFIIDAGDDKELYRTMETALSSKEKGQYKLDNNIIWWNNDKIYKGNIYIQLTTNPINAANADENEIKASTSKKYEQAQQVWDKINNQGPTDSKRVYQ